MTFEVAITEHFTTGLLCLRRDEFLDLIQGEAFAQLVPRSLRADFLDLGDDAEYLLYPPKGWRVTEEELVSVPVHEFAQAASGTRDLPN